LLPARPAVLQAKRSFAGVAASSCVVPREIPSCLSFFTRGIIDQDRTVISDRIGRLRTRGIGGFDPPGDAQHDPYLILIHVSVPQSEQCHSFKSLAFHFPLFFFGFKDRRKFSIIAYVLETHSKSNSSSIASYHMTALI
jgi:hypothetical protein